jgi:outer membrane receptor protein involved in Fe transport
MLRFALLLYGFLSWQASSAQDEYSSQPFVTGERLVLEEVIVTATRREQSVMEVPVAVSAFTGADLAQRGITEVSELAQVSSSLFINSNSSEAVGTEVRIRGIGTAGNNPGLEASVGVFIDGIYRSRSGLATGDLLDVESVEVLRGPQGTLFGRNTSAGAISIHTSEPQFDWGGYVEASLGNHESRELEAGITGPITADTLAFRLAANYRERDGYIDDRLEDRDFYDLDRSAGKGQLLWRPSESLDIRLIADYRKKKEECCIGDYEIAGPTSFAIEALGGVVKDEPFDYKAQTNFDSADEIDEWGTTLEAKWAVDADLRFTYLGGYRDADSYVNVDPDTSNVDLTQGVDWDQENDFYSHELRLNGIAGRWDWLVGVYYYDESIEVDWSVTYGSQFGNYFSLLTGGVVPPFLFPEGAGDTSRLFSQDASGWALFTHNIVELGDDWELVLGVRWSEDEKDATSVITNNAIHCDLASFVPYCPTPGFDESRGEGEPTGTLKLVRNLDRGNLYASYARGYKAGGFNLDRDAVVTDTVEFDPELVDTFEVGAKWTSSRYPLQLSSAVFYSDFSDFQLVEFDGVSFSVTNAGEVSSTGAEVDLTWQPTGGLILTLGATYLDTEFEKHPGVNRQGKPLEGQQVPFAPEWSVNGSVMYEYDFDKVTAFAMLNAAYTGEHSTDPKLDQQTEVDSYTLVNGRLGVRTPDARWELALWATNLFEEEYHLSLFDSPLQDGSWSSFRGEPRMYGASLRYQY